MAERSEMETWKLHDAVYFQEQGIRYLRGDQTWSYFKFVDGQQEFRCYTDELSWAIATAQAVVTVEWL